MIGHGSQWCTTVIEGSAGNVAGSLNAFHRPSSSFSTPSWDHRSSQCNPAFRGDRSNRCNATSVPHCVGRGIGRRRQSAGGRISVPLPSRFSLKGICGEGALVFPDNLDVDGDEQSSSVAVGDISQCFPTTMRTLDTVRDDPMTPGESSMDRPLKHPCGALCEGRRLGYRGDRPDIVVCDVQELI
ncbi:hypothetical protein PM082_007226 [Marasmius tenuissimus]|nr:hypothetical protein PM082_007226 [Marasmius tenuissimus]